MAQPLCHTCKCVLTEENCGSSIFLIRGRAAYCRLCDKARLAKYICENREQIRQKMAEKYKNRKRPLICECYRCKIPLTQENSCKSTFESGVGACRKCQKEKSKKYYIKNVEKLKIKYARYRSEHPELFKSYQKTRFDDFTEDEKKRYNSKNALKQMYGLTLEEFDNKIISQSGRCEICNIPLKVACVDHDHATDKVRDILCSHCNVMLGGAKDNEEILVSAIRYLRKHADGSLIQTESMKSGAE